MLFYTQIKREFTQASWKRGQIYFREQRVKDVKLDGDNLSGKVQGSGREAYETAIVMARGTIFSSKCSCPAHRQYETHCKHVAALAIWMVERGSLLRAGVKSSQHGIAPSDDQLGLRNAQKAAGDGRLRKLFQAHPFLATSTYVVRRDLMMGSIQGKDLSGNPFSIPVTLVEAAALLEYSKQESHESKSSKQAIIGEPVLHVRGIIQGKVFAALTVESGIRYIDPITKTIQVNTLTYLSRQPEPGIWKTSHGVLIRVLTPAETSDTEASFIQRLDTAKVIYQGQQALENLGKLLTHRNRDQIVFDRNVNVHVEPTPLKLTSLKIGEKGDKTRGLSYVFASASVRLTSEELEELEKQGRLSAHYVWRDDKIFRFSMSLIDLQRYANRSGVAASEEEGAPIGAAARGSLADDAQNPLHPIAAYRLSLELGADQLEVDPNWTEFHEWRKTFEQKKIASLPKIDYGFELRAYQENGLSWLWSLYHRGLAALLADEMGLGKTHQVLALLSTIYRKSPGSSEAAEAPAAAPAAKGAKKTAKNTTKAPERKLVKKAAAPKAGVKGMKSVREPTLVVAPTSVIAAWIQKLKKYDTGLRWHVFHGSGRTLPTSGVDIVLTTYGILHRAPELRERQWHVVVLDEAQAIKNASTISSRASRMLKSRFRIAMTGTPVENQATDLWSLMEFLLPGYLGSLPRFKRLYGWGREVPTDLQAEALKRLVSPFLLRRTKAKVLKELPEKIEEVVACEMTPIQRKAYRDCLNGAEATQVRANIVAGQKIDYANILALLTRLKQICDHPKLADLTSGKVKKAGALDPAETGKWETFDELLNEALGSNLKVVVFSQYLGMMDLIGHHLKSQGIGYTELRGDTPDRGARLELFSRDPECKVFLCSLLAGGLGIDLTSASVCIHFDRWWNPAKENQATDRLHRFGQTRGVQVFKLQIPGSVEDRIASIIESKIQLSGALIEESSLGLKAFSRKELLELLTPESGSAEASEETPAEATSTETTVTD
ncbi:MAG: DEAD/DEAH box helicase [Oligoflexia bacterium]|nr:DEAD/DEAH box helicase [Oligoflexia bacterium]